MDKRSTLRKYQSFKEDLMKTIVLAMAFFLLMGCILLQAEDFKLGCYSFLKANQDLSALNDSLISYMSQADYNLTICDTNEQSGQTDTNALLGKLSNAGIDAWLADYAREDPSTQTIGSHTASTANNWRFEHLALHKATPRLVT